MAEILAIETPALGDRSYLAHDGETAVVIDPQRDYDRVLALAERAGVRITHVAETHIHNDYVTGGLALSREAGAAYLVNAADPVRFGREPVTDGDAIDIGPATRLRVLATPGHTFTHLSYVLEADGEVAGVFTGGSLLFGTTGRPDLLGPASTPALARAQHASARRLARELPGTARIFPTHGFGSFCAATQAQASSSTIGQERRSNAVLTMGEGAYVRALLAGLDAYPAYYAHMGPANLAGPGGADLSLPQQAAPEEIRRRIAAGEWVVDLRDRVAFASGFVPGAVCFSLDGSFAPYLGWVLPWGTPVTLLGETADEVAEAQRELARIGIDRLAGAATGQPRDWSGGQPLASLRLATFSDLARAGGRRVVLDVRRDLEWADGHVDGALHIPFSDLPGRLTDIPEGEIWVYCRTGYRAVVAASILAAAGRQVVSIDDEFDHAHDAGLTLMRPGRELQERPR
jgi:glyoxylase-like metal-dependent hydrolase (beta-lactamase superfamily II)/rhodanese-related sulfurtransferase